jgi:hypothetical protein
MIAKREENAKELVHTQGQTMDVVGMSFQVSLKRHFHLKIFIV